jgi:hypothetical protein
MRSLVRPACFLGLLGGAGCFNRAESDPAPVVACDPPAEAECEICADPEGPCSIDPACACECVWTPGELGRPWWLDAPPADCVEDPFHDPIEAYDDCRENPEGSTPEQCGAPSTGAVICEGNGFSNVSRRTQLCLSASDCPGGMVCVVDGVPGDVDPQVYFSGACEVACDGRNPAECVRCDMGCNVDVGICQPREWPPPIPEPCVGDCQCSDGVCLGGYCNNETGLAARGLCGPGGDCPCNGGTCDGECCVLPGGEIAGYDNPACQP